MANPEHAKILWQGAEEWNLWREDNPEIKPDLSDANFSGTILIGADLSRADLSYTNLNRADLSSTDFSYTDLSYTDLRDTNLIETNLRSADLIEASVRSANLSGANLTEANLRSTDFRSANFIKAKLYSADLVEANLSSTNLSYADLRFANLSSTDLRYADLVAADLSSTDLRYADLVAADLRYAALNGTLIGWTVFADADLSTVKGLDTVSHDGPSHIGVDTIYKSGGNIPQDFLRKAGVPDNFITYMASLTGKAFNYYSCFISYASPDQDFAERLYADLQSKGVRCWYAPEDMKIGDKIRDRLDQTIRIHDKLLLVLSEHSINSSWVEKEVETAFEEEGRQNRLLLFPIQLDKTVEETQVAWASDIRRTRHIGDFTHWKDHDSYQAAFERLISDLQAESS